jgi:translation initiation factor IF-2
MNITELARKLKVPTKELRIKLPRLGFDIGPRAIKIPNVQARRVMEKWHKFIEEEKRRQARLAKEKEAEEKSSVAEAMEGKKEVVLPSSLTVRQLAEKLNLSPVRVINELMKNGVMATINKQIDFDTAAIVIEELGFSAKEMTDEKREQILAKESQKELAKLLEEKDKSKLKSRPPVIVVMGHVDHGKTALLDAIRKTNVVATEAGAITQHIGAYQVEKKGRMITFIDTPGHRAFRSMRVRGGQVADIAILVIAADDKIQPQTLEAVKIIQQEKLPFIVAINKIDKPEADVERIKKELAEIKLVPEDWGGKVICVPISAKTGQGLDDLLDMIILVASLEKEKLLANPDRPAIGTIIEAHLDKGEGPVATVLVQTGTLKVGDWISVAEAYGKIRALKDFQGKRIDESSPSRPAKIQGLKGLAQVGDILKVVEDKKGIKKKIKKADLKYQRKVFADRLKVVKERKAEAKDLNIIIRADVLGSLEAIGEALEELASQAWVIGFDVNISPATKELAREKDVEVTTYEVIYKLLDDVKKKMDSLLGTETFRTDLGQVEVLVIFRKEAKSIIIGGRVLKGKVAKNSKIEVLREKEIITEGFLKQLQINKKDVAEVTEGSECGIKFIGEPIIEVGDILQIYKEEEKKKKLKI